MVEFNQVQKNCPSCQAGLKALDKFCRQCGIQQATQEWEAPRTTSGFRKVTGTRAEAVTGDLPGDSSYIPL